MTAHRSLGKNIAHITEANILHESRVQVAALAHLLQESIYHVLQSRVLEVALSRLGEWGPEGQGDDNIIRILELAKTMIEGTEERRISGGADKDAWRREGSLHLVDGRSRSQVLDDGTNALDGHCRYARKSITRLPRDYLQDHSSKIVIDGRLPGLW